MMRVYTFALEVATMAHPYQEKDFLFAQIIYPAWLYRCFCCCERECQLALIAFQNGFVETMRSHIFKAHHALKDYENLLPLYLTGQYVHWYDGCQKVDYRQTVEMLRKLLRNI